MTTKFVWRATVLMLLMGAFLSSAMGAASEASARATALGVVTVVTKETQAKEGLEFTLNAVRVSDKVVMVQMEIPNKGNLRDLEAVHLWVGKDDTPELYTPLEMKRGKDNQISVTFQLSPEMASRADIWLGPTVLSQPTLRHHYVVRLPGYITDRKK